MDSMLVVLSYLNLRLSLDNPNLLLIIRLSLTGSKLPVHLFTRLVFHLLPHTLFICSLLGGWKNNGRNKVQVDGLWLFAKGIYLYQWLSKV